MNIYVPEYYNEFKCIADKCTHSCCIGWEIDIDSDTIDYYKTVRGPLGLRFKNSISEENEPHFKLAEGDRCPFLNDNGLCDIICELGEEALCNICSDHPRFRNYLTDGVEMGLGLCCEAAAELILTRTSPFALVASNDDEFHLSEEEEYVLNVRSKLINIMQNRMKPICERHKAILREYGIEMPKKTFCEWCDFYLGLERLDEEWTAVLECVKDANEYRVIYDINMDIAMEQLTIYFLYRHMPSAVCDGDIAEKVAFSVHACNIIAGISSIPAIQNMMISDCLKNKDDSYYVISTMINIARMYSSEIEYSDENLYMVFDEL